LLISLGIISCSENGTVNTERNILASAPTFANPYDSVGIMHNLVLDEFILRIDSLDAICDSAIFHDEFFEIIQQSYESLTNCVNCEDIESNFVNMINAKTQHATLEDYLDDAIGNPDFTQIYIDMDSIVSNAQNIDSVLTSLVYLEIKVDTLITDADEKAALFSALAVARHSSSYWYAEENDPNSVWRLGNGCEEPSSIRMKPGQGTGQRWGQVASADIGGTIGAAVGAAVAAVPIVIGPVAAAGAASTASAAIGEFWPEISAGVSSGITNFINWVASLFP
jgi:hypothetical protein